MAGGIWSFGEVDHFDISRQLDHCALAARTVLTGCGFGEAGGFVRAHQDGGFENGSVESVAIELGWRTAQARAMLDQSKGADCLNAEQAWLLAQSCFLVGNLQTVLESMLPGEGASIADLTIEGKRSVSQRSDAREEKSRRAERRNAPIIEEARRIQRESSKILSLTACAAEVLAEIAINDDFSAFRKKDNKDIRELIKRALPPLFEKAEGRQEWRPCKTEILNPDN